MPIGLSTGAIIALGATSAGVTAASGIYAANKQSGAAKTAATLQSQAEDRQRTYLEQKDAQDRADAERIDRLNRAQHDADEARAHGEYLSTQNLNIDQYNAEQSRLAPFHAQDAAKNRGMAYWLNLDQQHGASYINDPAYLAPHLGGDSAAGTTGVAVSPELSARVLDNYKALGLTPTGAGTGPTDSAYFISQYARTGGSTPENDAYWFGPNGRIAQEAAKAGLRVSPVTPPPPSQTAKPVVRTLASVAPVVVPPRTLANVDDSMRYAERA